MNVTSVSNNNFGANYTAVVKNQIGLHVRPCGLIAKITSYTDKPIFFSTRKSPERNVRGSLLSILTTEPTNGREIFIRTADDYPKNIIQAVLDCIAAPDDNVMTKIFNDFMSKVSH